MATSSLRVKYKTVCKAKLSSNLLASCQCMCMCTHALLCMVAGLKSVTDDYIWGFEGKIQIPVQSKVVSRSVCRPRTVSARWLASWVHNIHAIWICLASLMHWPCVSCNTRIADLFFIRLDVPNGGFLLVSCWALGQGLVSCFLLFRVRKLADWIC